jgi:transposase
MLHKVRDLLVRQRTMLINALRGHLAEFGIVAARGKRFLLRSAPRPAARLALRAAGVALPPTVQALAAD